MSIEKNTMPARLLWPPYREVIKAHLLITIAPASMYGFKSKSQAVFSYTLNSEGI